MVGMVGNLLVIDIHAGKSVCPPPREVIGSFIPLSRLQADPGGCLRHHSSAFRPRKL